MLGVWNLPCLVSASLNALSCFFVFLVVCTFRIKINTKCHNHQPMHSRTLTNSLWTTKKRSSEKFMQKNTTFGAHSHNGILSEQYQSLHFTTYLVLDIYITLHVNTCWAPQLETSSRRFSMATTELFSASTLQSCVTEWVTVALHSTLWISTKRGLIFIHIWLVPTQCTFCGHHTTMHQFTVSLYSKPHM